MRGVRASSIALWLYEVGGGVAIDQHRRGASAYHPKGSRDKCVGGQHHFVPRAHSDGTKRQFDGVGAIADANRVLQLAKRRESGFESGNLIPKDEGGAAKHPVPTRPDIRFNGVKLRFEIDKWDSHGRAS